MTKEAASNTQGPRAAGTCVGVQEAAASSRARGHGSPKRMRPKEGSQNKFGFKKAVSVNDEEAPREKKPCRCLMGVRKRRLFLKCVSNSGTAAQPATPASPEWEEQLNFV